MREEILKSACDVVGRSSVCAIVTAFQPDLEFPARIARLLDQVQDVVIVDDEGTDGSRIRMTRWFDRVSGVVMRFHPVNRGVAAALNTGLEQADAMGFLYALLLDDDSVVAPGVVAQLFSTYDKIQDSQLTILGINYRQTNRRALHSADVGFKKAPTIITAGSLIPLKVFREVGPFREDLFIDYVDHEYCLRARSKGVRILQCKEVGMAQPIGHTQMTMFGDLRSVHSPSRTYYFFRNSSLVAWEFGSQYPGFLMWTLWQQLKTVIKIVFFLRPKRPFYRAMIRGWVDCWAHRLGKISEDMAT